MNSIFIFGWTDELYFFRYKSMRLVKIKINQWTKRRVCHRFLPIDRYNQYQSNQIYRYRLLSIDFSWFSFYRSQFNTRFTDFLAESQFTCKQINRTLRLCSHYIPDSFSWLSGIVWTPIIWVTLHLFRARVLIKGIKESQVAILRDSLLGGWVFIFKIFIGGGRAGGGNFVAKYDAKPPASTPK